MGWDMAGKKGRSHFIVLGAQSNFDRVFNSLAEGERKSNVSAKVLKKVLEGTPVTKMKALQVAKTIWHQDRTAVDDPLEWVKDVRDS